MILRPTRSKKVRDAIDEYFNSFVFNAIYTEYKKRDNHIYDVSKRLKIDLNEHYNIAQKTDHLKKTRDFIDYVKNTVNANNLAYARHLYVLTLRLMQNSSNEYNFKKTINDKIYEIIFSPTDYPLEDSGPNSDATDKESEFYYILICLKKKRIKMIQMKIE